MASPQLGSKVRRSDQTSAHEDTARKAQLQRMLWTTREFVHPTVDSESCRHRPSARLLTRHMAHPTLQWSESFIKVRTHTPKIAVLL